MGFEKWLLAMIDIAPITKLQSTLAAIITGKVHFIIVNHLTDITGLVLYDGQ
jgi:hypothetical protein